MPANKIKETGSGKVMGRRPPPDETPEEMNARLQREAEADTGTDETDEEMDARLRAEVERDS